MTNSIIFFVLLLWKQALSESGRTHVQFDYSFEEAFVAGDQTSFDAFVVIDRKVENERELVNFFLALSIPNDLYSIIYKKFRLPFCSRGSISPQLILVPSPKPEHCEFKESVTFKLVSVIIDNNKWLFHGRFFFNIEFRGDIKFFTCPIILFEDQQPIRLHLKKSEEFIEYYEKEGKLQEWKDGQIETEDSQNHKRSSLNQEGNQIAEREQIPPQPMGNEEEPANFENQTESKGEPASSENQTKSKTVLLLIWLSISAILLIILYSLVGKKYMSRNKSIEEYIGTEIEI